MLSIWPLCWQGSCGCTWGPCPTTIPQLPYLKSPYESPTLQFQVTDWLSMHSTSPKCKLSLSQGWTQPIVSSDSFRRQNFFLELSWLVLQLWTCCLLCVCSLSLPNSIYHSKSLPIRFGGFLYGTRLPVPHSGRCRSYSAVFSVCSLLCYRCHAQGISPSTYKISYWLVKSILCTLWLQKFISSEILLIVKVTCQKISQKSILVAQALGSASIYMATIFLPLLHMTGLLDHIFKN